MLFRPSTTIGNEKKNTERTKSRRERGEMSDERTRGVSDST